MVADLAVMFLMGVVLFGKAAWLFSPVINK